MTDGRFAEHDQAALWNGAGGDAWVETQDLLDRMFAPLETLIIDAVPAQSASRVLDIGCGTGSTTLAAARRLGPAGHALGIDISGPMLALARARAERAQLAAEFVHADAQTYPLAPASADVLISRFGVMFFADPVAAFANLHRAARRGAALRFIAWRSAAENPFMTAAERAAAPFLPALPARRPDVPGQFAFADGRRVESILQQSGWSDVDVRPGDVELTLSERDLTEYVSRLGPVGLVLREADDQTRARVVEIVRAAFDPYRNGSEVRFTAGCWMANARA